MGYYNSIKSAPMNARLPACLPTCLPGEVITWIGYASEV